MTRERASVAMPRGMTLLEIMVVIVILGLVTTLVAMNVRSAHADAEVQAAMLELRSLRQGLELFRVKQGRWPAADEGLDVLFSTGIVQAVRRTDPWGEPYRYVPPAAGGEPEVHSTGPDRTRGTTDDLVVGAPVR